MTDTNTQAQASSTPPTKVDPAEKYVDRADAELPAGTEDQFTVQQKVTLGVFITRTRQAAEYYNQTQWDFDEVARHYRLAVDSGDLERIAATKAAFEAFLVSVIGGASDKKARQLDLDYRDTGRAVVDDLKKIVLDHYVGPSSNPEDATLEQLAEAPRLLAEGSQKTITRYFNSAWDKDFVDVKVDPIDALLKSLLAGQGPDAAQRRRLN